MLVVDDEEHNLELVRRALRSRCEVLFATSGQQALKLLRDSPDVFLILSDMRMPTMSGAAFLDEARRLVPDAVRALMTGFADHDAIAEAINVGRIWSYLKKPVTITDLQHLFDSALDVFGLGRENRRLVRELEAANRSLVEKQRLLELGLDQRSKELLEANRKLEELAVRDGLTGLYNHRHLHERLQEEVARSQRHGTPLALMFIDIDHFKQYNDRHGHMRGDELLRELARLLREGVVEANLKVGVRETDVVARYGGEEFVVLMPQTSKSDCMIAARRLCQAIAAHPFSGREKQPGGVLSVSIGLAHLPDDAKDAATLLDRADQALYKAKREGRNRVMTV